MTKALRLLLVAGIVMAGSFGSIALADVDNASATNVQDGDNDTSTEQEGSANSGDAVAGSVVGVVSSGDASVDATNRSEDVDIETGDADGENDAASFTGLNVSTDTDIRASDVSDSDAVNLQDGDNSTDLSQTAEAVTGDGVGGQVIGVVTSAGGSADVVAANTSEDVDIETGDSDATNDAASFVGLNAATETDIDSSDISDVTTGTNIQEGDNDLEAEQDATSASGDGVGGQVLGIVSAGDASVDATNRSEDVDLETGDTFAENDFAAFVGLNVSTDTDIDASDVTDTTGTNVQEGDNDKELGQTAEAASGDAVGGQVAGVVTSAGGSADLVLANTTEDADADSGDSDFDNEDESFTGLNVGSFLDI